MPLSLNASLTREFPEVPPVYTGLLLSTHTQPQVGDNHSTVSLAVWECLSLSVQIVTVLFYSSFSDIFWKIYIHFLSQMSLLLDTFFGRERENNYDEGHTGKFDIKNLNEETWNLSLF